MLDKDIRIFVINMIVALFLIASVKLFRIYIENKNDFIIFGIFLTLFCYL